MEWIFGESVCSANDHGQRKMCNLPKYVAGTNPIHAFARNWLVRNSTTPACSCP